MSFSENSTRFLDENQKRNNRDWFVQHKADYETHIKEPMRELARALIPTMLKIDPLLILDPGRAVCRIYRDTRFSRDKSMFKRASWLVFQRSKGMTHPVWFFEFTPEFHRYGCGYYAAPPAVMARVRELVLANDKRYREAREALDGLRGFSLEGECYRRTRHPDAPADQREWLERKNIAAMHSSEDARRLFSPSLATRVAESFRKLAPVYFFLMHAHETAMPNKKAPRRAQHDDRDDGED